MSSAFVTTPFGGLPKQETFVVKGIFSTGFFEFDQNFIFLNIEDALSIFDKDENEQILKYIYQIQCKQTNIRVK